MIRNTKFEGFIEGHEVLISQPIFSSFFFVLKCFGRVIHNAVAERDIFAFFCFLFYYFVSDTFQTKRRQFFVLLF